MDCALERGRTSPRKTRAPRGAAVALPQCDGRPSGVVKKPEKNSQQREERQIFTRSSSSPASLGVTFPRFERWGAKAKSRKGLPPEGDPQFGLDPELRPPGLARD